MICELCPRRCGVNREDVHGFCGVGSEIVVARAALHMWEEPCISGKNGSGTIFFSGCNLGCVYCQNEEISHGCYGIPVTDDRFVEIMNDLIGQGAHNINLVTPSHYADVIARILREHKPSVPVVWNSSGYESIETLRQLDGLVDVYLPDMKYMSAELAAKYSRAADYPKVCTDAIREMLRQTGKPKFDDNGMLVRGVLIRHLVLPGCVENTLDVLDFIDSFPQDMVLFGIMSQFTPTKALDKYPEINRRITEEEYSRVKDYVYLLGLENGYMQDLSSASESYIPDFDLTGIASSR